MIADFSGEQRLRARNQALDVGGKLPIGMADMCDTSFHLSGSVHNTN